MKKQQPPPPKDDNETLWTAGIVAGADHAPVVQFHLKGIRFQLLPGEARDLAYAILRAAETAESDSFLVHFLEEKIGVKDPNIVRVMLNDFREFREARARKDYLPR